jgi:hypothetical protein
LSPYEDDEDENPMLTMKMGSIDNFTVVYWSGEEATKEMTLETYKDGISNLVQAFTNLSDCDIISGFFTHFNF